MENITLFQPVWFYKIPNEEAHGDLFKHLYPKALESNLGSCYV